MTEDATLRHNPQQSCNKLSRITEMLIVICYTKTHKQDQRNIDFHRPHKMLSRDSILLTIQLVQIFFFFFFTEKKMPGIIHN
jgi:hypothetical protein